MRIESRPSPRDPRPWLGTVWLPAEEPSGVVVVYLATARPERFYRALLSTWWARTRRRDLRLPRHRRSGDPREHRHLRMRDRMVVTCPRSPPGRVPGSRTCR
ncbi:hypothetical protein QJS66_21455 [Kocuria rhizophila]|nr:hypothetical protein QJS66_21455 [Kocuria rhizophila]